MKYKIRHSTKFQYKEPVNICHNRLCLSPIDTISQKHITSTITIFPEPDEISYRKDFFGNNVLFFSIYKEHVKLEVISESEVSTEDLFLQNIASDTFIPWQDVYQLIHKKTEVHEDIVQYLLPSTYIPYSETIRNYALDCFPVGASLWDCCNNLMNKIFRDIKFTPGYTTINTPVESVLKSKKGVCQDIAHLMITCFRNINLPARYVSGYLETIPPPGQKKLVGSDASHAWVAVYFPAIGWIDFDPTNCQLATNRHITVAYGRDYQDVAPTKGIVFSSGKQKLTVEVDVERLS